GDGLGVDAAVEVLPEQRGLDEEDVTVEHSPLVQPDRPALAAVLRWCDAAGGVLPGQPEQLVLAADVVVEAGHAHAEAVRHVLHRERLEPDVAGRLGDALARDHRWSPHPSTLGGGGVLGGGHPGNGTGPALVDVIPEPASTNAVRRVVARLNHLVY